MENPEKPKVKTGFGALRLLGCIYTPLGGGLMLIGIIVGIATGMYPFILAFGAGGGIFLTLGLTFLVISFRKKKRLEKMVAEGCYFYGEVIDVEIVRNVTVNHYNPIRLVVSMQDPMGNTHVFRSEIIHPGVRPAWIGKRVRVYAQQGNLDNYYVDVDSIEKTVIEH